MTRFVHTAALALLTACGADLPEGSASSEHFTVYYRAGREPCDGILDELEAHRSALIDWLGTPAPERVHYYLYEDSDDLRANSPCGTRCGGRRDGRLEVHTHRAGIDDHELLHVYLHRVSEPPTALLEGLAVALECHLDAVPRPQLTLDELLDEAGPYLDSQYYDAAGYLVRYLLETYGKRRVLDFYLATDGRSNAALRDEVQAFFGAELDEAWENSVGIDPWRVAACPCPLGGAGPGQATSFGGGQGCGFLSRAVFEISDGPVRVEVTNRRSMPVRVASCFGEAWAPPSSGVLFDSSRYSDRADPGSDEEPLTRLLYAALDPGRYFVATEDPENIDLKVFETRAMGASCQALQADVLEPPIDMAFLWKKGERPYVGFMTSRPAVRLLAGRPSPGESSFDVCASCGGPEEECQASFAWPAGENWMGPLPQTSARYSLELAPAD